MESITYEDIAAIMTMVAMVLAYVQFRQSHDIRDLQGAVISLAKANGYREEVSHD